MNSLIKIIYENIIRKENFVYVTVQELIDKSAIRMIKPSELPVFKQQKIYLSTSSIENDKIISNEGYIAYNSRPSRAQMFPYKNSIWFAKMKNSIKVLLSSESIENNFVLSTGFYGFYSDNHELLKWLKQVFISRNFNYQKDKFSEGSSMFGIKDNQLNDIIIPYMADITKLKSVNDSLNSFNDLVIIKQEVLENMYQIKKYLMIYLFI